ncbi:MAG: type II toxin-antitoxin system RelE/ParE family toxin [Acidobacteriia bacterium]|nr:type II toxin-antitoxin system RelE/ParE family toxin [Terriglobia bacterium]
MTESPPPRKVPLIFFRTGAGAEPVREWLKELPEAERHAVGKDFLRAQWRWPAGMPLCRPMGGGLWEIRTDLPDLHQTCSASLHHSQQPLQRGGIKTAADFDSSPTGKLNRQAAGPLATRYCAAGGHLHRQPTLPLCDPADRLLLPSTIARQRR